MTTAMRALIGGAAMAAALAGPSPASAEPRSFGPLRAALSRLSAGRAPCVRLSGGYDDGNGLAGFTRLKLVGGTVRVWHDDPRRRRQLRFSGRLTGSECKALARAVLDARLWTVRAKKKHGVPEETRPTIAISVEGVAGAISAWLWATEARANGRFAALQRVWLAIARRVSKGRVTY